VGRERGLALTTSFVARGQTTGNFNVILTHYDLILKDKAPLGKVDWKYIVVDEGHRLKNDKSKLAEVLRNSYKFKHRLLLTGTPINVRGPVSLSACPEGPNVRRVGRRRLD